MERHDGWPINDDEREDLLREAEGSGLSIRAYAEEVGISPHTLYSWRSRLRHRQEPSSSDQVQFIELKLGEADLPTKPELPVAEVVLKHGVSVRIHRGFDRGELEELLRVVLRTC